MKPAAVGLKQQGDTELHSCIIWFRRFFGTICMLSSIISYGLFLILFLLAAFLANKDVYKDIELV